MTHQGDALPTTINELETVEHFASLGSTINNGLSIEHELQTRIGRAARTFNRPCDWAWLKKYLTILTKRRIYECCILYTLLYGAEAWTTYARHEKKLNAYHLSCLQRIMGIACWDRITNKEVLKDVLVAAHYTGSVFYQTLKAYLSLHLSFLCLLEDFLVDWCAFSLFILLLQTTSFPTRFYW